MSCAKPAKPKTKKKKPERKLTTYKIPVSRIHPMYPVCLAYKHHRQRILDARTETDSWNTIHNFFFRVARGKIKKDWDNKFEKMNKDFHMLSIFTQANLGGGIVKSFGQGTFLPSPGTWAERELQKIEKQNEIIGSYIINAKAIVGSFNPKYAKEKTVKEFRVPEKLFEKCPKCKVEICTYGEPWVRNALYPKIYVDMAVRDQMNFGRVEIQLYMLAAPQLVRDIVKICADKQLDKLRVLKMFLDLWIVFELDLPSDSHCSAVLEGDKSILTNMNLPGIMSFSEKYLEEGATMSRLNFSMCVRPIPLLNERRVPFGRIVSNLCMLEQIQEFGTPKGNPKKRIIITDCGIV